VQPDCIAANPGGQLVVTNSTTSTYVAQDTPVGQQVNQHSTTLKAILNGTQNVYQQTFAVAFTDLEMAPSQSGRQSCRPSLRSHPRRHRLPKAMHEGERARGIGQSAALTLLKLRQAPGSAVPLDPPLQLAANDFRHRLRA
jgi:hypothetical protein